MYRVTINGLLAIRDLPDTGDHHVYTALCRSVTRYMDMVHGISLRDYVDVTSIVDTLPETDMALFSIDDSKLSYGFWFDCVCTAVDLVTTNNQYGFCSKDMEAIWRHFLSKQYWKSIYTTPQEDVTKFVMEHYLNPYVYHLDKECMYPEQPDIISINLP